MGDSTGRKSVLADPLKVWTEEAGSSLPALSELIDADLILALWDAGDSERWWPETFVHSERRQPTLIGDLEDPGFARNLIVALGLSVEKLRANAADLKQLLGRWLRHYPFPPLHNFDPDTIRVE